MSFGAAGGSSTPKCYNGLCYDQYGNPVNSDGTPRTQGVNNGAVYGSSSGMASPASQSMGGDTGSSATGQYTPASNQPTDRGAGAKPSGNVGAGGGPSTGPTPGQMNAASGEENLPAGQWYSNLADQLYGSSSALADPGTFWMTYANKALGLPGFSATGAWLGNTIGNPVGLSEALGNRIDSNAGALAGGTALGNYLGNSRAGFNPGQLINNVISQVMSFDPSKDLDPNGGLKQGASPLALQLWDQDPGKTVDNIVNFLVGDQGILKGILTPQLFNGVRNALLIADSNIREGLIQNPHGLESVDKSGGSTKWAGGQLMNILGQFGVI